MRFFKTPIRPSIFSSMLAFFFVYLLSGCSVFSLTENASAPAKQLNAKAQEFRSVKLESAIVGAAIGVLYGKLKGKDTRDTAKYAAGGALVGAGAGHAIDQKKQAVAQAQQQIGDIKAALDQSIVQLKEMNKLAEQVTAQQQAKILSTDQKTNLQKAQAQVLASRMSQLKADTTILRLAHSKTERKKKKINESIDLLASQFEKQELDEVRQMVVTYEQEQNLLQQSLDILVRLATSQFEKAS